MKPNEAPQLSVALIQSSWKVPIYVLYVCMCINVKNYNFCCCSRFSYSCCFKALDAQLSISVIFSLLKLQLLLGGRKRVRGIWGIGYVGRECCHLPLSTRNITMLSLVLLVGGRVALRLVSFCLLSSRLVSFVQWITFLDVLFANNHRRQCSAPCGVCVPVCIENYVARTHSYSHTHTYTHPFYYKHAQAAQTQWHVTRLLFNLWSRARKNCALWQNLQHRLPMGMGEDQEEEDALLSRLYWQWEGERNAEKEAEWLSYT